MRFLLVTALLLTSCASVPDYDQIAYDRGTQLKVDAIQVMSMAVEPARIHAKEISNLKLKMEYAYEYEKGKGDTNVFTIKQYELMMNPEGALLYGFLDRWQNSETGFSRYFITEASTLVEQGFDEIIRMEWNKR